MATSRICAIDGCDKRAVSRGWCNMHYTRFHRHGNPNITQRAACGEGLKFLESLVGHDGDECVTWPYSQNLQGYGQTFYCRRVSGAHRVMCILAYGPPPSPRHQAAHSCGKGHLGCVNPRHLRWATPKENIADKFDLHGWRNERDAQGRITGITLI